MSDSEFRSRKAQPWKRRIRFLSYSILVLLVLLIAAHAAYDRYLVIRVRKEMASVGLSIDGKSLHAEQSVVLAEDRNAYMKYCEAAALIAALSGSPNDNPVLAFFADPTPAHQAAVLALSPERQAALGQALPDFGPTLDTIREADQSPGFQGPSIVELGQGYIEALAPLVSVSRFLAVQAVWDSLGGRPDQAGACLLAGLRLSNRLSNNAFLATDTCRVQMADHLLGAAQEVLKRGGIPLALHSAMHQELAQLMDRSSIVETLRRERAYTLEGMHENWGFDVGIRAYVARPWLNRNRVGTLKLFSDSIRAVELTDPAAQAEAYAAIEGWAESAQILSYILAPAILQILEKDTRLAAKAQLLSVGIALDALKKSQGQYPESLEALDLPARPAGDRGLYDRAWLDYRREGDGFVLEALLSPFSGADELRLTLDD